ncbi:hypothetical protein RhiirA4_541650 [Rhizophagus irregularis]|uniref:Uncharacterized protein n=1 Tax=Rhizophagus irregularis TaxID=588596 RepID=A0A2I1GC25_9GLOM|nr:hypothetical protein RhiirA4_541650 [Rhizophagus irregularis]
MTRLQKSQKNTVQNKTEEVLEIKDSDGQGHGCGCGRGRGHGHDSKNPSASPIQVLKTNTEVVIKLSIPSIATAEATEKPGDGKNQAGGCTLM